jgi:hypothetical protein
MLTFLILLASIKNYIFEHYAASIAKGPQTLSKKIGLMGSRKTYIQQPPRLICHGRTSNVPVAFDGIDYQFDRRAPIHCDPWTIKKGDPFVVIGFNKHTGSPPGPHAPGIIPPWLPGHLHWFIMTDTKDGKSHYTYGFYNQDPGMGYDGSQDPSLAFGGVLNTGKLLRNN